VLDDIDGLIPDGQNGTGDSDDDDISTEIQLTLDVDMSDKDLSSNTTDDYIELYNDALEQLELIFGVGNVVIDNIFHGSLNIVFTVTGSAEDIVTNGQALSETPVTVGGVQALPSSVAVVNDDNSVTDINTITPEDLESTEGSG